jgi:hypothetical protein
MNRRSPLLWSVVAVIALWAGYFLTRPRDSATREQAIELVSKVRSGKGTMEQQTAWLCHLLDGKTSFGAAFSPHHCAWQATKVGPFLWRVEYQDRAVALDGRPTALDKIWLLDTRSMELQPRTIATLMLTAPELAGVSSNKQIDERFIALTGLPFSAHASSMNAELDTLPRWRIGRDGALTRA